MRSHLNMEQQQPVVRLTAKGLPLREIGSPPACSHQGAALIVALPSGGRPATMGGGPDKGGRHWPAREITPGSP